jgi:hypothetical protein
VAESTSKYRSLRALTIAALLIFGFHGVRCLQDSRIQSGPYKGFLQEEPELNRVELPNPFTVAVVQGTIFYRLHSPLANAAFEIRDSSGRVRTVFTGNDGQFKIEGVPPGVYQFKVTKNQFESVVGKVIVLRKVSRKKTISIQLQLGA